MLMSMFNQAVNYFEVEVHHLQHCTSHLMLKCRPALQHRLQLFQGHLSPILHHHLDPLLNWTNQCSILTIKCNLEVKHSWEILIQNGIRFTHGYIFRSLLERHFAFERFLSSNDFAYSDWKHGERERSFKASKEHNPWTGHGKMDCLQWNGAPKTRISLSLCRISIEKQ